MQFDPSKGTQLSSSPSTALKRSLAQQATASARKAPRIEGTETSASASASSVSRATSGGFPPVFSPEFEMPTPSSSSSHLSSNSWSRGGSSGQRATRKEPPAFQGAKSKAKRNVRPRATVFEGPLHDGDCIVAQYNRQYSGTPSPKPADVQHPKSALFNWHQKVRAAPPQFEYAEGLMDGQQMWRYVFDCLHFDVGLILGQMQCDCTEHT